MAFSPESTDAIRFGVFTADLRAGELRKGGVKVKLQEQPFQILAMLLEKPGEVITREELRQRLWPADTFVDFDHSLNTAVKKLREALGDDADNPRFVETLHRRGYRFIAPVGQAGLAGSGRTGEGVLATHASAQEGAAEPGLERKVSLGSVLALLAAVLVFGAAYMLWRPGARDTSQAALPEMQVVPFTTARGNEFSPAFSPDGRQIAYAAAEMGAASDLYVQMLGTSSPLRLTNTPSAAESFPTWSPDGRYVAFMRYEMPGLAAGEKQVREASLMVVPVLGGPERKLLSVQEDVGMPAWSHDGKNIVISERSGAQKAIALFLLSLDTLVKRQLTHPDARTMGDFGGRFSPDGRQVAFLRNTRETSDVYLVPAAGGEERRLTFENSIFSGLDWTTDGRELIFSSFQGSANPALWRVSASGTNLRRLGVGGDGVSTPSVAAQGNRLAYVQIRWNEDIARFAIPKPGGRAEPAALLIASTQNEEGPQYSPDGRKIAFQSTRSGSYEVWVCDADGSNPFQLTSFRGPLTGTPRWSPDGKQLAFDSRPTQFAQIYAIQAEGGSPQQLTSGTFNHVTPSWSRDGKWIYFASDRSGSWQVWKMSAEGGNLKQVTQKGGFAGFESYDGKYFYYSLRIDAPGIWRVPVEGGEEVEVVKNPPAGFWGYWALDRDGIYYLRAQEKPGKRGAKDLQAVVEYFAFATGRKREIARPGKDPYYGAPGLAVSPDGKYLLYLQVTEQSSDIMLVENFR